MNDTCEAPQADKPLPGTIEAVRRALLANRANTLALVECLRVAQQERPFREAEELVADNSQAMALTFQSPHALYDILVNCGGVERTEVPEEEEEETSRRDGSESDAIAAGATTELPDQPTDYTLVITPAGAEALAEFKGILPHLGNFLMHFHSCRITLVFHAARAMIDFQPGALNRQFIFAWDTRYLQ